MTQLEKLSSNACFWGNVEKYSHYSEACKCVMKFSIFVPNALDKNKLPALFFLSGLTCTEDNFIQKAGAIKMASKLRMFLVCPDTSPRGCNIEGEGDSYDLGTGAGFYLDATEPKWSKNYNMYTYITKELSELIFNNFQVDPNRVSISGHSMGGHGALTIAFKNPGMFKSCSAFAPICNPSKCNWGQKAFTNYLGQDQSKWSEYDATELLKKSDGKNELPVFISQGLQDEFYEKNELLLSNLVDQVKDLDLDGHTDTPFKVVTHTEYDHSYWFIQTFIDEHLEFHAKYLGIQI